MVLPALEQGGDGDAPQHVAGRAAGRTPGSLQAWARHLACPLGCPVAGSVGSNDESTITYQGLQCFIRPSCVLDRHPTLQEDTAA